MYRLIWIFFIYAFLGWCTEVSYAALKTGTFVNRGFLNGPLCPIYGFGVVIVLACLTPLKSYFPLLFLGSVVLTSLLEWITGFVLEKLFHQRWWDYSEEPFNLNGYICLRFSIAWGFACVFVVDIVHPAILWFINVIPHLLGVILLAGMGAGMAVDLTATVRTITKMNHRLDRIDELAGRIKVASNDFGEDLSAHVIEAAERGISWKETMNTWKAEQKAELAELKEGAVQRREAAREELRELHEKLRAELEAQSRGQRRLLKAFPRLRSIDRQQALEHMRRHMESRIGT